MPFIVYRYLKVVDKYNSNLLISAFVTAGRKIPDLHNPNTELSCAVYVRV